MSYYGKAKEHIHGATRLTRSVSNGDLIWRGAETNVGPPYVARISEESSSMDPLTPRAEEQNRDVPPWIPGLVLRVSILKSVLLLTMGNRN